MIFETKIMVFAKEIFIPYCSCDLTESKDLSA